LDNSLTCGDSGDGSLSVSITGVQVMTASASRSALLRSNSGH
jgi:hypothetical protein